VRTGRAPSAVCVALVLLSAKACTEPPARVGGGGDGEGPPALDMGGEEGHDDLGRADMGSGDALVSWYGEWHAIQGTVETGKPLPDPPTGEAIGLVAFTFDAGTAQLISKWCLLSVETSDAFSWEYIGDGTARLTRSEEPDAEDWLSGELLLRTGANCGELAIYRVNTDGTEQVLFDNNGSDWMSRGEVCLLSCDPPNIAFDYCDGRPPLACN
jgi:hypothetical protein